MIIAIDGPAGAGKSTVAKLLAQELGFLYIDTGAMYRALTLKAIENGLKISDVKSLIELARSSQISLLRNPDASLKVLLDNRDVSLLIRQPLITRFVSDVAKIKDVRSVMVSLQRQMGKENNCVLEGRDIGTVVFPVAEKKFFIDANPDERVKRRFKDMKNMKLESVTMEDVAADLKNRDTIDTTREVAPLKKADDAVYIDTTNMTIDEVVATMLSKIRGSNNKAPNSNAQI